MGQVQYEDMLQVTVAGNDLMIRSSDIREVVKPAGLTPVPMGPEHLLGLANIQGQIVCMIDIARLLAWEAEAAASDAGIRFVVLRHPQKHVGIRVDAIKRMHRVAVPANAATQTSLLGDVEIDGQSYPLIDCSSLLH